MAEAIAFGASVIAFLQVTDRVVELTKGIINAGKDAPAALRTLHAEASSMREIVGELKKLYDTAEPRKSAAIGRNTHQPVETCLISVQKLEAELSKLSVSLDYAEIEPSRRQKFKQSLTWVAGGVGRVKKLIADMITQKTTLTLALLTDMSHDVQDLKASIGRVEYHITATERHEITKWLQRTNPSQLHNRSHSLYEEHTGNWVLRSAEWAGFLDGPDRSLWIHGIPGAGKTVLASHLIEQLRSRQSDRVASAYYYCHFGRSQDETGPFLDWITAQLCQQAAFIPRELEKAYNSELHSGTRAQLEILAAVLDRFDVVFITIDAIDESMPYDNLLDALIHLMTEPRFDKLRLLLTSREYFDIEQAIKPHAVSLPMENRLVQEDIQTYISSRLSKHHVFYSWPAEFLKEIAKALAQRANGMFRWAVCQIDILGRLKSISAVRAALAELPRTLDETYERILFSLPEEHREFARKTLEILVAQSDLGHYPLTPPVLLGMVLRSLGVCADSLYAIDDIRQMCGCLISFAPSNQALDMPMQASEEHVEHVFLAHYTVKEFLYAQRTSLHSLAAVSFFALRSETVVCQWAELVLRTALSASSSPLERPDSGFDVEDYCIDAARGVIAAWGDILAGAGLADLCFDFLNPAAAYHLRGTFVDHFMMRWSRLGPPAHHRIAALAECCNDGHWHLAAAALEKLEARDIVETPLEIVLWNDYKGKAAAEIPSFLSLFFAPACNDLMSHWSLKDTDMETWRKRSVCSLLAPKVGWESLLFVATIEHGYDVVGGRIPRDITFLSVASVGPKRNQAHTPLMAWIIQQRAKVNACPCRLTPLQTAVQLWDDKAVEILLKNGAHANAVGSLQGYDLPGAGLDAGAVYDSPLRILRTRPCLLYRHLDSSPTSHLDHQSTLLAWKRLRIEELLLEAGARDFTVLS